MDDSPKKLQGGAAFDSLLGKLAKVPKKEVERKERALKKSRAKKRKPGDQDGSASK